jgi:hypothetical protein
MVMKFIKHFTALAMMAVCGFGFAQANANVGIADLGGQLSLNGKAGVEYAMRSLTLDGTAYYGGKGSSNINPDDSDSAPLSKDNFDLDWQLGFDYQNNGTWMKSTIRTNNEMGSSSTTGDKYINRDGSEQTWSMSLTEAYFGMNLYEDGAASLNFNIGREKMSNVFNSKVQFDTRTRHDGLRLNYMNSFETLGDFSVTLSKWIDREAGHRYPWGTELGLSNIMETGLYASYSYVSWVKKEAGVVVDNTRSRNSQVSAGYMFNPDLLGVDWNVYTAYIINHAAKKNADSTVNADADSMMVNTLDKKENSAWYVGTTFGKLQGEGSWQLDLNYQHVKQNSILNRDIAGIGRYNMMGSNYKGFALKIDYAITDNLDFAMSYFDAKQANKNYSSRVASSTISTGALERKFKRVETELWYHF